MKHEWVIVHSKANADICSGANIGLKFFCRYLEQNVPVQYVAFRGATWSAQNAVARLIGKVGSIFSSLFAAISLYRKCGEGKIVYQNAFSGFFAAFRTIVFSLIALRGACACLILHVRNGNLTETSAWKLYRYFLSCHADKVVFVAQFKSLAESFKKAGFEAYVLRNIIEEPKKSSEIMRSSIPTFCFVGTKFESKGVVDFVKAALEVSIAKPIRVIIAGPSVSPDVDTKLDQLRHGHENFEDLGVIDRDGVEKVLRSAHYIVLPTRYKAESVPRVLIEAISMGCIPIATDHAGISEQVGEVSKICSAPELEAAIRSAVQEVETGNWDGWSEAAQKYFRANFAPNNLRNFITRIEKRFE